MYDSKIWLPPPEMSVSQWADEYRYLSQEGSAEPGRWNTSRAPYQRGMMDAVKDTERIVIMTAAQVGKSELLLNIIGYYAHKDPSPVLMLQPTLQMGEDFSKERLAPMIRDTPALSTVFPDPKSRYSGNTLLHKVFSGGYITIAGANSPAGLASRPIRILLCDEVDRYPESAGSEGDPLTLAMKRTANFWNRRIVWVSTPTIKGISRIEKAFDLSTREEWCVPCPKCGEYQAYTWGQFIFKDRTEPVMKCVKCGQEFSRQEWQSGAGKWTAPEEKDNANPPRWRGFHMNALASPWVSWPEIAADYMEAYNSGEEALKGWTGTALGEPYELKEGTIDIESIAERLDDYPETLPEGVKLLTCGVDVQDNRLELEVLGWGADFETWGVEYRVFYGTPGGSEVWEKLDEYLSRTWLNAANEELGVACTCIDSGGHFTDEVYKFVRGKSGRRIFAIVGRGSFGHPCVSGPTRNNRRKIPLFTLGVSTLKGMLFSRLQSPRGRAGYCHFPRDAKTGYDSIYFNGLLSERMVVERRNGRDILRWEKREGIKRNEPLDCRVYAMGAYEILSPRMTRLKPKIPLQDSQPPVQSRAESAPLKVKRVIRRIPLFTL